MKTTKVCNGKKALPSLLALDRHCFWGKLRNSRRRNANMKNLFPTRNVKSAKQRKKKKIRNQNSKHTKLSLKGKVKAVVGNSRWWVVSVWCTLYRGEVESSYPRDVGTRGSGTKSSQFSLSHVWHLKYLGWTSRLAHLVQIGLGHILLNAPVNS